ncbi:hypothetical protein J7I94_37315 [Streptomyces sp. ISL-12]|uniref:hypothetical protein n=1 Tax=Streptomyces sp. ISL-12 TaxID=2819177 RepID=UPI001BED1433|nr:hypothetical protein [Streptomyces sp. ISL-12]MBT2416119.1 hypothetical protein [Streptomyces sp. ISL-12]
MYVRARAARLAVAASAAVAALAVAAVPAAAVPPGLSGSGAPGFLEPADLPPHPSSDWSAGPVTAGQPDPLPMCVGDALPSTSAHRRYWTEYDTGALQVTVVERDEGRAAAFAALLRDGLADCARTLADQDPEVTATQRYYGRLDVEEGADVFGVHTGTTWGASDVALFSVGRDGRIVTVVQWGQMGALADAPVDAFEATTVTAVGKLS